jgi:hypothetical protein
MPGSPTQAVSSVPIGPWDPARIDQEIFQIRAAQPFAEHDDLAARRGDQVGLDAEFPRGGQKPGAVRIKPAETGERESEASSHRRTAPLRSLLPVLLNLGLSRPGNCRARV